MFTLHLVIHFDSLKEYTRHLMWQPDYSFIKVMSNWERWYISLFHTDHKHLDVKSLSEGILKNVNVIDESYHKKSSLLCQWRRRLVPTWHLWIRHVSDHTPLLSLQITVSDYDDQRKDISTMYNRITLKQLQRMAPSVSITYTQKNNKNVWNQM